MSPPSVVADLAATPPETRLQKALGVPGFVARIGKPRLAVLARMSKK